jgi:hypothetical protein
VRVEGCCAIAAAFLRVPPFFRQVAVIPVARKLAACGRTYLY